MRGEKIASRRGYDRTDRLRSLLLEILAEQLSIIEDPKLEFVYFSGVDVDRDLNRALVYFSSLNRGSSDVGGVGSGSSDVDRVGSGSSDVGGVGSDNSDVGSVGPASNTTTIAEALSAHIHGFRRAIAKQAHLRRIPELVFLPDQSFQHGAHIEEVLRGLSQRDSFPSQKDNSPS